MCAQEYKKKFIHPFVPQATPSKVPFQVSTQDDDKSLEIGFRVFHTRLDDDKTLETGFRVFVKNPNWG